MFKKKCGSFALCIGILSSITCQGTSGAGNAWGNVGLYTLNKLKQAKDFVSKNPVKASDIGLALASIPFFTYAGCKYYFGKEDAGLEKGEVSGNKTTEEIKNGVNDVPVDEKKIHDSNKPTNRVQTEQSKSNSDDTEVEKNTKVDSNTAAADQANNGTDSTPSAGINIENENANTEKNLSSVYLGVYSEPIVYLILCLISKIPAVEKLNLLEKWYNFSHYQNGCSANPLKMLLATLLFIDGCTLICSTFYLIWRIIKDKDTTIKKSRCFVTFLMAVSPVISRFVGIMAAIDEQKNSIIPCIFGLGSSSILWHITNKRKSSYLKALFPTKTKPIETNSVEIRRFFLK